MRAMLGVLAGLAALSSCATLGRAKKTSGADRCTTDGALVREAERFVREELQARPFWSEALRVDLEATQSTPSSVVAEAELCRALAADLERRGETADEVAVLRVGTGYVVRAAGGRRAFALYRADRTFVGGVMSR